MLTTLAPRLAAVAVAWANSPVDVLLSVTPAVNGTETSSRWQLGQAADAMSMSSEVSTPICSSMLRPFLLVCGAGCAPPLKLTSFRQPLPVVHAGSPYVE